MEFRGNGHTERDTIPRNYQEEQARAIMREKCTQKTQRNEEKI